MSQAGNTGGVAVRHWRKSKRFHKDYDKLDHAMRDKADDALQLLAQDPRPHSIRFEKLKGYADPAIYSIHVTGNYKISFEIDGSDAFLRRVAEHDEIDRAP